MDALRFTRNNGSICDITSTGRKTTQYLEIMFNEHFNQGIKYTYKAKTLNWRSLKLFSSCRNDRETKKEVMLGMKSRLKIYSGDLHNAMLFR